MDKYRVKPGEKIKLKDFDPNDISQFSDGKQAALVQLSELNQKLDKLQDVLYAEHKHKILVVLQALDAGGKDGSIEWDKSSGSACGEFQGTIRTGTRSRLPMANPSTGARQRRIGGL